MNLHNVKPLMPIKTKTMQKIKDEVIEKIIKEIRDDDGLFDASLDYLDNTYEFDHKQLDVDGDHMLYIDVRTWEEHRLTSSATYDSPAEYESSDSVEFGGAFYQIDGEDVPLDAEVVERLRKGIEGR